MKNLKFKEKAEYENEELLSASKLMNEYIERGEELPTKLVKSLKAFYEKDQSTR